MPTISENGKRKIRILVVEDNPVNKNVAQAMLRMMGLGGFGAKAERRRPQVLV